MMRRLEIVFFLLLGIVGGAVGSAYYYHQAPVQTDKPAVRAIVAEMASTGDLQLPAKPPVTDTAAVRGIVAEMIGDYDLKHKQSSPVTVASLDPKTLDPMIEN